MTGRDSILDTILNPLRNAINDTWAESEIGPERSQIYFLSNAEYEFFWIFSKQLGKICYYYILYILFSIIPFNGIFSLEIKYRI